MQLFNWLNDQLLRMDWLSGLVRVLLEDGLGLGLSSRVGASLHFFTYDVIKIFILLAVLIFSISWMQSYFPPERTRRILSGMSGLKAKISAGLLGTLTPFCSCSSIPLFIGFTSAGLVLAVLAVLAVLGGTLIGRARMERYIEALVLHSPLLDIPQEQLTRRERAQFAWAQVSDIFRRVWLYVLLGVGIGAAIHNWIPAAWIESLLGQANWWSVPLATLVGVPMYADIFGTLPIAEALVAQGVGLGTALAFMMAVTALSLPSLIMLKKVVKAPRSRPCLRPEPHAGRVTGRRVDNAVACPPLPHCRPSGTPCTSNICAAMSSPGSPAPSPWCPSASPSPWWPTSTR